MSARVKTGDLAPCGIHFLGQCICQRLTWTIGGTEFTKPVQPAAFPRLAQFSVGPFYFGLRRNTFGDWSYRIGIGGLGIKVDFS